MVDKGPEKYCIGPDSKFCPGELVWIKIKGEVGHLRSAVVLEILPHGGLTKVALISNGRRLMRKEFDITRTQSGEQH